MTIKLWFGHKKYVIKKWLKEHKPHIVAVTALAALWVIALFYLSNQVTTFIDKEFIAPTIYTEKLK